MHGPFTKSSFFYLDETYQLDFFMTCIAGDSLECCVQGFELTLQYLEEVVLVAISTPVTPFAALFLVLLARIEFTRSKSATLVQRLLYVIEFNCPATVLVFLSFLIVSGVMGFDRRTSRSRLSPSGVSSYAQAKNKANGNPVANSTNTVFITQPGVPKLSDTNCNICAINQAIST
jgi:hypothetical protein